MKKLSLVVVLSVFLLGSCFAQTVNVKLNVCMYVNATDINNTDVSVKPIIVPVEKDGRNCIQSIEAPDQPWSIQVVPNQPRVYCSTTSKEITLVDSAFCRVNGRLNLQYGFPGRDYIVQHLLQIRQYGNVGALSILSAGVPAQAAICTSSNRCENTSIATPPGYSLGSELFFMNRSCDLGVSRNCWLW
jgi:hypothetical protein